MDTDTTTVDSLKTALRIAAREWHRLNEASWDAVENNDTTTQNIVDAQRAEVTTTVGFLWTQLLKMGHRVEWPIA